MSKKKPRFFCDNCGYEVGSEVRNCPYCGRIFASIRCPICDYSGPDKMFQNGCPMCGYSAAPTKAPKLKKIKPPRREDRPPDALPFWTYVAAFAVVALIVALLSWVVTR
ncbi:MAG: zinc ribbon domain-containing protein [Treponema sp.]|jgi:hypothetical protein|nr:zinc ribbon domain-containing protein [Treponema sp.]